MLNYAETASSSTIVPWMSVPHSQCQKNVADCTSSLSSVSSYAIGPVDPMQITLLQAHLSSGEECSLLVPIHLPLSFFIDPMFKEGYEWGYLDGELEAQWSVPHLVNWTFNTLSQELWDERAWEALGLHLPAWIVGWVLGDLARLAETERTLALVGIAHLCFLLPFLSLDTPFWPPCSVQRAHFPHTQALRTYRAQVRTYREQGKSFAEAQRLALAASAR